MYKNSSYFTIRLIWFYLILGELLSDKKYSFRETGQNLYKNFLFLYKFSENLGRFLKRVYDGLFRTCGRKKVACPNFSLDLVNNHFILYFCE